MTLAEIFVQLPPDVAETLERLLEGCTLSSKPTEDEVFVAAELVVDGVKNAHPNEYALAYDLLAQVPQAVVDQIFK